MHESDDQAVRLSCIVYFGERSWERISGAPGGTSRFTFTLSRDQSKGLTVNSACVIVGAGAVFLGLIKAKSIVSTLNTRFTIEPCFEVDQEVLDITPEVDMHALDRDVYPQRLTPKRGEHLFEALVTSERNRTLLSQLVRLAHAEHALQLANLLLEIADFGGTHDLVVGLNGFTAALGHAAPPVEKLTRCYSMDSGNVRNRHSRPVWLLDEPHFLLDSEPAPAFDAGDDLDSFLRHSNIHRRTPRPYSYATCRVEMGAALLGPQPANDAQNYKRRGFQADIANSRDAVTTKYVNLPSAVLHPLSCKRCRPGFPGRHKGEKESCLLAGLRSCCCFTYNATN